MTLLKNIIIVIVGALVVFFVLSKVTHAPVPVVEEPTPIIDAFDNETKLISLKGVEIYISMPHPNEVSGSPLKISGRAPGNWFFEASAPVTLTNWDGLIIGESYVQAQGEWMTTNYVPFEGEIIFPEGNLYNRGFLIFKKDNPSGLPENDDSVEMMIKIK